MIFSRNTSSPVHSFSLNVSSGGHDKPVAFGPGSALNGSVMLTLDKPAEIYNIRVVFKCEEQDTNKQSTIIFCVESTVWGKPRSVGQTRQLTAGSHMYLFAIKLPHVNYPPSMRDTYIGHRVEYSLQAFLELHNDAQSCIETLAVPIMYLPLVTCNLPGRHPESKKTQTFRRGDAVIEVNAELIKPAYCPGDLCTIKLTVNNHSDCKINNVQISLVSTATSHSLSTTETNRSETPILGINHYDSKRHTVYSENVFTSIPKYAKNHQSILQFRIPPHCIPTTHNYVGKYLDISYEVVLSMPIMGGSVGQVPGSSSVWSFPFGTQSSSMNAFVNTIQLPMIIATVPMSYPLPPQLQIPVQVQGDAIEIPSFIPNIESPLPSPSNTSFNENQWHHERPSVSPSSSINMSWEDDPMDDGEGYVTKFESQQDASGHLMVPTLGDGAPYSRRKSSSSSTSGLSNSPSISSASNQVAVQ
ncbi:uncharacterized protein BYT42DRAFT_563269 [Radiomyces spectabilis]|uniref:uncharacterized protein n=1 Tax=Radiomyces spectabilis TaxID=64574 RepID=UPI00221FE9E9|nr:uncharacterized protein BYT42DRAFT_563269 [Radiomyces spectabilis]KAI8384672.1 hypothetical protein BYT42DRAFT_563269 [Radiomyces spectabilis]